MSDQRDYWTIGTRDFRHIMSVELASHEAAMQYREDVSLADWVIVSVSETETGRAYVSPEMPAGPIVMPAAGSF